MKIDPDLLSTSALAMTEEEARARYGPARTNGYLRGETNDGMAMDDALAEAGHYGMLCHVADFIGHNVLPQFPGYGVLAGLSQNGLIRAGVEMIADEMTRQWIELTRKGDSGDDDKDDSMLADLSSELERFGVPKLFRKAMEMCGFYGGCLVYIDTGEDDPARLLNPLTLDAATFTPGSLKGFRLIEPFNVAPGSYNASEPWSPTYFKPSTWWVLGKQIHASRFLYFSNSEVTTLLRPVYNFFGISTTQIVLDAVKHFTDCREAEARLLKKFSMTVLKTDMSVVLQGGGKEELDRRIQFMTQHRDNDGILAINNGAPEAGGEDIIKLETPLSGVTDIVSQAMEIVAAYFSEPATKLWGISPAGFNATGESDMTNHYDHIASQQEKIFHAPLLQTLQVVQMNLYRSIDKSIASAFKPLGEDDGRARAEVQKIKAETDAQLVMAGAVSTEEVRARLSNDPDSGYNHIDVDDVPDVATEEEVLDGEEDETQVPNHEPDPAERG